MTKLISNAEVDFYLNNGFKSKVPVCCNLFFSFEYMGKLNQFLDFQYGDLAINNTAIIPCPSCLVDIMKFISKNKGKKFQLSVGQTTREVL